MVEADVGRGIAARDAGVNLAFFGANSIYWQMRFEASSSGVANRVMVCYKDADLDPITDPSLTTVKWRQGPVNRPEQKLPGVQFTDGPNNGSATYVVTNSGNWVYAGTGFKDGDTVPGIVGYEADQLFSTYPQPNAAPGMYTLLSNSPMNGGVANSSVYQALSGAWVFSAGTLDWSLKLDDFGGNVVDARIQQTTKNILDRAINTQPDFNPQMTSPSPGSVLSGSSVTFNWTASLNAVAYWLGVGTGLGKANLFTGGTGSTTHQTVTDLPLLGTPV